MARGAKPVVKKPKIKSSKAKKASKLSKPTSDGESSENETPKFLTNDFLGQLNDKKTKQVTRKQKGTGEAEEIDRSISFLPSTKKQKKIIVEEDDQENKENTINSALPERYNTTTVTSYKKAGEDPVEWKDATDDEFEEVPIPGAPIEEHTESSKNIPTEDITM